MTNHGKENGSHGTQTPNTHPRAKRPSEFGEHSKVWGSWRDKWRTYDCPARLNTLNLPEKNTFQTMEPCAVSHVQPVDVRWPVEACPLQGPTPTNALVKESAYHPYHPYHPYLTFLTAVIFWTSRAFVQHQCCRFQAPHFIWHLDPFKKARTKKALRYHPQVQKWWCCLLHPSLTNFFVVKTMAKRSGRLHCDLRKGVWAPCKAGCCHQMHSPCSEAAKGVPEKQETVGTDHWKHSSTKHWGNANGTFYFVRCQKMWASGFEIDESISF